MKIVLDTNVLISGVFWGGNPKKIIALSISGEVDLYATEEIMREYFRIIEKISKKDEDLLVLNPFRGVDILKPNEFLKSLNH